MAKHIHIHLHRRTTDRKAKDAVGKPYEPDEIYRNGKRWEKTEEMIPFNGKPARKYKEKGGHRYITREVESGTVHDAWKPFTTYDPREVNRLDRMIADLEVEARSESGETRRKTLAEIEKLKKERARYHSDDAYRGSFTTEIPVEEYGRYKVKEGSTMTYMGLRVSISKVSKVAAHKTSTGELMPEKAFVMMETVDAVRDSKLEDLERQLDELETEIEKLEDLGQSPSRAQLDKRKELQGAIAVIKSARKTGDSPSTEIQKQIAAQERLIAAAKARNASEAVLGPMGRRLGVLREELEKAQAKAA